MGRGSDPKYQLQWTMAGIFKTQKAKGFSIVKCWMYKSIEHSREWTKALPKSMLTHAFNQRLISLKLRNWLKWCYSLEAPAWKNAKASCSCISLPCQEYHCIQNLWTYSWVMPAGSHVARAHVLVEASSSENRRIVVKAQCSSLWRMQLQKRSYIWVDRALRQDLKIPYPIRILSSHPRPEAAHLQVLLHTSICPHQGLQSSCVWLITYPWWLWVFRSVPCILAGLFSWLADSVWKMPFPELWPADPAVISLWSAPLSCWWHTFSQHSYPDNLFGRCPSLFAPIQHDTHI